MQSNFGGRLRIHGRDATERQSEEDRDGSCMIVIATDAPLDTRNLERLAQRAFVGMARTGASFSNGSGDYAIAFSTSRATFDGGATVGNSKMSPYFAAVADATEEAILDSLFLAHPVGGVPALR